MTSVTFKNIKANNPSYNPVVGKASILGEITKDNKPCLTPYSTAVQNNTVSVGGTHNQRYTDALNFYASAYYTQSGSGRVFPHPTEPNLFVAAAMLYNGSSYAIAISLYKVSEDVADRGAVTLVSSRVISTQAGHDVMSIKMIGDTVFLPIRRPNGSYGYAVYACKVNATSIDSARVVYSTSLNYAAIADTRNLHIDGYQKEDGTFRLLHIMKKVYNASYNNTDEARSHVHDWDINIFDWDYTTQNRSNSLQKYKKFNTEVIPNFLVYNKKYDCWYAMYCNRRYVEPANSINYSYQYHSYDVLKLNANEGNTDIDIKNMPVAFTSTAGYNNLFKPLLTEEGNTLYLGCSDIFNGYRYGGVSDERDGVLQFNINSNGDLQMPKFIYDTYFISTSYTLKQNKGMIIKSGYTNGTYNNHLRYYGAKNGKIVNDYNNLNANTYHNDMNACTNMLEHIVLKNGMIVLFGCQNSGTGGRARAAVYFREEAGETYEPVRQFGLKHVLCVADDEFLAYGEYKASQTLVDAFPNQEIIAGQYYSVDSGGTLVKSKSKATILGLPNNTIFMNTIPLKP